MLFIDTANIEEIKKYKDLGVIEGVTTNQKILLKDKQTDLSKTIHNLLKVCKDMPINIELTKTSGTDNELVKEARKYFSFSDQIVIKIPMWSDGRGLRIAKRLKDKGIPVNITCCMTTEQVILAALTNVTYISLFFNRIIDYSINTQKLGYDRGYQIACETISDSRDYLNEIGSNAQIIAGSIRDPTDVTSCLISGADIVTVPPKILEQMFQHPKTEETIKEFDEAWKKLNRK